MPVGQCRLCGKNVRPRRTDGLIPSYCSKCREETDRRVREIERLQQEGFQVAYSVDDDELRRLMAISYGRSYGASLPDTAALSEVEARIRQVVKRFATLVAGVGFPNPDGTTRQSIIRTLQPGDLLRLTPEPDNAFDPRAVRIMTQDGRQIGYLMSDLNDGQIAESIHNGAGCAGAVIAVEEFDSNTEGKRLRLLGVRFELRWQQFHGFNFSDWKVPGRRSDRPRDVGT